MKIVQYYLIHYHQAMDALNVLPPEALSLMLDILSSKLSW